MFSSPEGIWSHAFPYQPVSFKLISRSGTELEAQFAHMVAACAGAGVDIYVDAVINHMANAQGGEGRGGSPIGALRVDALLLCVLCGRMEGGV